MIYGVVHSLPCFLCCHYRWFDSSPVNLDAKHGPLKPGDRGMIVEIQDEDLGVAQPILVKTLRGEKFWYCKTALALVRTACIRLHLLLLLCLPHFTSLRFCSTFVLCPCVHN